MILVYILWQTENKLIPKLENTLVTEESSQGTIKPETVNCATGIPENKHSQLTTTVSIFPIEIIWRAYFDFLKVFCVDGHTFKP